MHHACKSVKVRDILYNNSSHRDLKPTEERLNVIAQKFQRLVCIGILDREGDGDALRITPTRAICKVKTLARLYPGAVSRFVDSRTWPGCVKLHMEPVD